MNTATDTSGMIPVQHATSSQWLTTGQVARRLGYSREQVRRWCVDDKCPAMQIGHEGEWRIPAWWLREQLEKIAPKRRR